MKSLRKKILGLTFGVTAIAGVMVLIGGKAVPVPVAAAIFGVAGLPIGMAVWGFLEPRLRQIEEAFKRTQEYDYEKLAPFIANDEFDFLHEHVNAMMAKVRESKQQARDSTQEVLDLVQIGQVMNESRNRGQVVTRVIEESLKRIGAQSAAILLLNESRGELIVEAVRGNGCPFRTNEVVSDSNPVYQQVATQRRPIIIGGGVRSRVSGQAEPASEGNTACVPLIVEGSLIGMLAVSDKNGGASFTGRDTDILSYLGNSAALVLENSLLQRNLNEVFLKVVGSLASAVDQRDPFTRSHSKRVTEYAVAIGRARSLEPNDMDTLQFGAILHDIGKIGIRDSVLLKDGRLTEEEFEVIKSHPVRGEMILESITLPWPVLPIIRSHHERYGGGGYPDGIKGDQISPLARIVTVADVFDAITSKRSYRNAMPLDQALGEVRRGTNSLFDPRLVPTAIEVLRLEFERVSVLYPDV